MSYKKSINQQSTKKLAMFWIRSLDLTSKQQLAGRGIKKIVAGRREH
jgi:hypothetical protein